jgi:hypothetical protein
MTAPTLSDVIRASSHIEAHRRMADDGLVYPDALLESAETLSAALMAARDGGPGPEVISLRVVDDDDRFPLLSAVILAFCAGFALAAVVMVLLIPDQPDRILVPVDPSVAVVAPRLDA